MQVLDEAPVLDGEIDSLGHMNVRYDLARVDRANRALLSEMEVLAARTPGTIVRR